VILGLIIYFGSKSDPFLSVANFENVGRNLGPIALLALGQAFVILLGQIDISQGAIVGLSTVTTALAVNEFGMIGFAAAPLTGAAVGLVNGSIVAKFHVHAVVGKFPEAFAWIGIGKVGPLPAPLAIGIVAFLVASMVLRYTRFGPMLYATGGNEEAARLAGINVDRVKIAAFVIAGMLAGLAGLIFASRIQSGQPNLGAGLELQAIAAAVVGGIALTGGKGTIGGVVLGVLVLTILQNGLDITNVSSYTQQIIIGVVILIAIVVDRLRERQSGAAPETTPTTETAG
jgi:ribose transport system permease protein